ncbi:SDR family oxidoreductase [Actinosynnema sp. NPDC053489]|uniref:SDR family oxidoreductase n=1 Tax=Actinosynnema sp. NPDC053489 TaxID=3363916 RepID=UPI0037C82FAF
MSTYFATGATGFLGRRPVAELLRLPDCERVFALVRPQSADEPEPHDRLTAVPGDPGSPIEADRVDHVVHPAARYDFTSSEDEHRAVNVDGTRRVVEYARRTGCGLLHHVSSVAVAGDHRGAFTEDDFDLGQHLPSPYHATEHAAEAIVRWQGTPWRAYRPGVVVGDSRTGETDKADGPYHFFPAPADAAGAPKVRVGVPLPPPAAITTAVPTEPGIPPAVLPHVALRAAYLASKSGLDAFSRVAAGETPGDGVMFTSVRMPLVRTPKIGPTEVYDAVPAATPERAARWVVRAPERRPGEVNLPAGVLAEPARKVAPKPVRSLLHLAYRAVPERGAPRTSPLAAVTAGVTRLALRATR